jgi:lipoprotein-anchoring transpeptidase ErfK/SrfK
MTFRYADAPAPSETAMRQPIDDPAVHAATATHTTAQAEVTRLEALAAAYHADATVAVRAGDSAALTALRAAHELLPVQLDTARLTALDAALALAEAQAAFWDAQAAALWPAIPAAEQAVIAAQQAEQQARYEYTDSKQRAQTQHENGRALKSQRIALLRQQLQTVAAVVAAPPRANRLV